MTIIPFRSATLPPGELAAVLAAVPAALPAAEARVVESKGATMLDPATLALFVGAGATALTGLVAAVATVWAARIAARAATASAAAAARPDERPRTLVIVVETAQTTVRVAIDPADPRAAVVAAPLPAALSEVVAVRLEV